MKDNKKTTKIAKTIFLYEIKEFYIIITSPQNNKYPIDNKAV